MIRIACHVQDYYFEIIKKYFANYFPQESIEKVLESQQVSD